MTLTITENNSNNNDGLELAKEFSQFKELHKRLIISSCLIICEDEGIYDTQLLNYYSDISETGKDKAELVFQDLQERRDNGDNVLDSVYEMCWDRIKNCISDNKSYYL